MDRAKRQALEAAGFQVGDVSELLGLTPDERRLVEFRVRLAGTIRHYRQRRHLTQAQLAKRIGSNQARIAKVEAAASGISLELMMRALFAVAEDLKIEMQITERASGRKGSKKSPTGKKLVAGRKIQAMKARKRVRQPVQA